VQIDYIQHQKMGHDVSFSASITKKFFFGVGALFCVRLFLPSLISVNHEEVTSNWPILFNSGTQLYNGRARHTKCTSVHLVSQKNAGVIVFSTAPHLHLNLVLVINA
jgi:hypothetical protein